MYKLLSREELAVWLYTYQVLKFDHYYFWMIVKGQIECMRSRPHRKKKRVDLSLTYLVQNVDI